MKSKVKRKKVYFITVVVGFAICMVGVIFGSRLVFQRTCERRTTPWSDLGTADDDEYRILMDAYKIKNQSNETVMIQALVFAGLVTVGFLLLLYLPRRVIGFKDFMNSVPEGGKLMMPAILILVLAWTLKGMTDALGIGTFVRSAINLNSSLMNFVPLVIFCIAIFIAFSSGTSWGTFAIFVPIVVNMFAELDPTMMIISVAAVLAGAVCGDHISPISDTTIMSSSGAQSNHINHVQTQMQYAFVVIAVCAVGYLIAGFTENWWLTLLCSLAILTGVLLEIRKREMCGR